MGDWGRGGFSFPFSFHLWPTDVMGDDLHEVEKIGTMQSLVDLTGEVE